MDDIRKLLKDKELLLNIMEVGCGSPISEYFMSKDGASKYIYGSQSPYHKRAQWTAIGKKFDYRSVSGQFVKDAIKKMMGDRYSIGPECIDIAISMQVGLDKDNHGWVCISDTDIYHFTFGHSIGRDLARVRIVDLVIDLLFVHYGEKPELDASNSRYIDGHFFHSDEEFSVTHFIINKMPKHHAPFMIIDGKWERATVGLRNYHNLNIVKGSFNPYHAAHQELMEHFPGESILSITTGGTVEGKENITTEEAIERVWKAKQPAIIDSGWRYYQDLVDGLQSYVDLGDTELHFSMGVDAFARFSPIAGINTHVFARNIEVDDTRFYVSKHPDISSTKIREKNESNNRPDRESV